MAAAAITALTLAARGGGGDGTETTADGSTSAATTPAATTEASEATVEQYASLVAKNAGEWRATVADIDDTCADPDALANDGSIFTDERCRPLTYERWKSVWKATGASFKTHDLRHYAASALIAGGASVKRGAVHPRPRVTSGHVGCLFASVAGR
jgi:hypothetical protein